MPIDILHKKGNKMKTEDILELKFKCDDLGEVITIRGFLKALLYTLWDEEESFSGKRPFGNSGWTYTVYKVLIKNKAIEGELDEDGYIDSMDEKEARGVILKCIKAL